MSWLLCATDSNSPNWWSGLCFPPLLKTDPRAQWDLEGEHPAQGSFKNCSQLVQTLTSPCPPPAHTYSHWLSQECLSYIFPPASSHSLILKAVGRYHLHIYEKTWGLAALLSATHERWPNWFTVKLQHSLCSCLSGSQALEQSPLGLFLPLAWLLSLLWLIWILIWQLPWPLCPDRA